jgi:hypothetical protein
MDGGAKSEQNLLTLGIGEGIGKQGKESARKANT